MQFEGDKLQVRWHDQGLSITKIPSLESIEFTQEEAMEFTSLWTMGQGALSVGRSMFFQIPSMPGPLDDGDD